jgi:hypothetical protein
VMPETATMDMPFVGSTPPTTHSKGRLDEAAWVRGLRAWGTAGQAAHQVLRVVVMGGG